MSLNYEKKENFAGKVVEVIGENFEKGKPSSLENGKWTHKLESREEILYYLQNAEKYWYGKDEE